MQKELSLSVTMSSGHGHLQRLVELVNGTAFIGSNQWSRDSFMTAYLRQTSPTELWDE